MVATYFDKGKGRTGPVEYVLDAQRVQSGEATLLRGNAQITKDLIKTNNNELKYRSGVLSFTEQDIPEAQKQAIMDEFEKSTFAGMEKDQYNILWVQHKDKDKLELHFVIPRLELTTNKAFNPHWHKADQDRLILFQDIQNSKYNLTNPYEAERANTLQMPTKWDNRSQVKEQINDVIVQGVSTGQLQNRDQIIEFLESNDLEVKRSNKGKLSKNFIAVREKGTEDYIRLKGAYYNESFTSTAEVGKQLTAREREHSFTTPEQLREAEQRLDKAIQTRAKYNNERYQRAEQEQDISQSLDINSISNSHNRDNQRGLHIGTEVSHEPESHTNRTEQRVESVASAREPEVRERRKQVHQEPELSPRQNKRELLHQNRGVSNENRTRTDIRTTASEDTETITRQQEQEQRAYREARQARAELYKSITERSKAIRAELEQNSNELSREYEPTIKQSRDLVETAREIEKPITRVIDSIRELGRECGEYIKDTRDKIKNKIQHYADRFNDLSFKKDNTILNEGLNTPKEELTFDVQESCRNSLNENVDYHNNKINQQIQERSQSRGYEMSM